MIENAVHPIIYVRGYAMTQSEIDDTVADPYMGFNIGSCKVRHSGYFGIVNSEEGYQNLVRFLYGDVRADGYLEVDEVTLPPAVEEQRAAGREVHASYHFEVSVSVRNKTWQLHRRTVSENSAVFRKFEDLFSGKDPATGKWIANRDQAPMLFNVFLDTAQSQQNDWQ